MYHHSVIMTKILPPYPALPPTTPLTETWEVCCEAYMAHYVVRSHYEPGSEENNTHYTDGCVGLYSDTNVGPPRAPGRLLCVSILHISLSLSLPLSLWSSNLPLSPSFSVELSSLSLSLSLSLSPPVQYFFLLFTVYCLLRSCATNTKTNS